MLQISLQQLGAIAEIIGAGTIVTGLIFGALQLRAYRSQQRDRVATNLMQTFYNPEFSRALIVVQSLQDGITTKEMHEKGREIEDAAVVVSTALETMGLLVYKKIAPFDLVMELTCGMVIVMHRKLKTWIMEKRKTLDHASWAEWFEWLAIQAEKHASEKVPAHLRKDDWHP